MQKFVRKIYRVVVCVCLSVLFGFFTINDNIQYLVLASNILLFTFIIIHNNTSYRQKNKNFKAPILLFLSCFIIRYLYCHFMDGYINQIYDFGLVLEKAKTGTFTEYLLYYRMFLHKFFYPFLLHILHITSQPKILLFQCICVSFIAVVLFYIGKEIASERLGMIQAILFIMWPAQVVYTQVITEEHIAALLLTIIIFLVICIVKKLERVDTIRDHRDNVVKVLAIAFFTGIICGICAFFKDWALVGLVAIVICSLYLFLGYDNHKRILLVGCVICILIGRMGIEKGFIFFAENRLGGVRCNNGNAVYLYVTLDPDATGGYDLDRYIEYFNIAEENDYDFKKTDKVAMGILKEKIRKGYEKVPQLLLHKGREAYMSDEHMFDIALKHEVNDSFQLIFSWLLPVVKYIGMIYYMGIVILLLLSSLIPNRYNFLILLCILGGVLVNLLIECQGRYKYSIEPIWCIPAAYALIYWNKDNVLRVCYKSFSPWTDLYSSNKESDRKQNTC